MDNASIQAFLKAAIIPLDGVAEVSRFTYVNLGRDARGVEELWRVLDQPLQLGTVRIDEVPVYFEIIGQLHERAQYVCDPNQDIDHLSDMAFCGWFEPRRSVVSELQWDRYAVCLRKLHALVSDTVVGTEELYVPDAETGLIRIQAGSFSSAERRGLPIRVADVNETLHLPKRLEDLEFGVPLRILFTINYIPPQRNNGLGAMMGNLRDVQRV